MKDLNGFKVYSIRRGDSLESINTNMYILHNLFGKIGIITKETVEQFIIEHLEKDGSKGYLNRIIGTVRKWGKYTGDEELTKIKYFIIKDTHKATMSDKEIQDFLDLPFIKQRASNKKNYEAWTLFFKIMAYTGMRPGEVAGLNAESIALGRGVFDLSKTKTSPRLVPIPPIVIPDLLKQVQLMEGEYLFTRKGRKFNKHMWQHYFEMRIKRLGIKRKDLSLYSLRHSFITRMLEEDVNIFKVQKIVGHRDIKTTAVYTHLGTKDVIKAIKQDRLSKGALTPQEVIQDLGRTLSSLELGTDPRFKYVLAENGDSIVFKLAIKKDNPTLPAKL